MTGRKRFPPCLGGGDVGSSHHPFSLLTLIQPDRSRPGKHSLTDEEDEIPGQALVHHGGNDDGLQYRHPPTSVTNVVVVDTSLPSSSHYQTQAADLSLATHHHHQQLYELAAVGSADSPPPPPPPPALAAHHHHQLYEDSFYGAAASGDTSIDQNEEYLNPGQPSLPQYDQEALAHYSEYYARYPYTDVSLADGDVNARDDRLVYDYSIKPDISNHNYRFLEVGGGGSVVPLLPPPLYPSPAVLLHIKYVMESVCDSMCFTDVTIITATDTLRAHRSVLAAHSSFLCYLLSDSLHEAATASEDPVLHFPHYPSLYVRMLLQFFYTGEVSRMSQEDIEPLREICYCLGISSLITRLDDVKLTISFQNIPSYDVHIPPVQPQDKTSSGIFCPFTPEASSGSKEEPQDSDSLCGPPLAAQRPPSLPLPLTQQEEISALPTAREGEQQQQEHTSCKYLESKERIKVMKARRSADGGDYDRSPTRQYTVVSKMPKDTNLQVSTKCEKCDLRFFKAESLASHQRLHEGERFTCSLCNKTISSKYHLNIHMQTHANQKYPCSYIGCDKEFSDPSALRRHNRNVHAAIRHQCAKCGKSFGDRSTWKRHVDAHSPRIVYTCSVCGKGFKRVSQLKRHKRSLHQSAAAAEQNTSQEQSINSLPSVDEKNPPTNTDTGASSASSSSIHCKSCRAVFRKPYDLKVHERVHTGEKPYPCRLCAKTFARSYNLQLHIRTHTGEKPHACARCGRCFSDVAAFRRHCRTHSGERPYACSLCGAKFTQASTAYNHQATCRKKRANSPEKSSLPAPSHLQPPLIKTS